MRNVGKVEVNIRFPDRQPNTYTSFRIAAPRVAPSDDYIALHQEYQQLYQLSAHQRIKQLPLFTQPVMLSRHLQFATRSVSRSALFSTSSVRALDKVSAPAMDTPEKKPDSQSNSNAKPDNFKPEGQAPGDKTSDAELKRQAEHAGQDKTKNDGIYKRTGQ